MKKPPIRKMKSQAQPATDEVIQEQSTTTKVSSMAKKKTEISAYGKYSGFVENTLGIGRNGKRVLHGSATAAGTWAAGHYGGIELINNNMPTALIGGAVAGVLGTVAMDHLFLSEEDEASLLLSAAQQASDEVQAQLLKELGFQDADMSIKSLIESMRKTG